MLKLDDIDTSKCLYDPKKSSLINDMKKVDEFNFRSSYQLPMRGVYTYIILMYDSSCSLWREVRNLPARKGVAMTLAGFKTDKEGRFERPIELILEGKNRDVNSAVVKYLVLQNSPQWAQLIAYENLYYYELAKIQNGAYGKANDIIKSIDTLAVQITKLTEEILGGRGEAVPIMEAIYKEVTKDLDVSPERVSQYISDSGNVPDDWCPYDEWANQKKDTKVRYPLGEIKFVGDK